MKPKPLDNLLTSEMDRKDFLKYMGATVLALSGISTAIRVITKNPNTTKRSNHFGSGVYAGDKKSLSSHI